MLCMGNQHLSTVLKDSALHGKAVDERSLMDVHDNVKRTMHACQAVASELVHPVQAWEVLATPQEDCNVAQVRGRELVQQWLCS
jgi:hypothetical protein